jgi:hypothetical protein
MIALQVRQLIELAVATEPPKEVRFVPIFGRPQHSDQVCFRRLVVACPTLTPWVP